MKAKAIERVLDLLFPPQCTVCQRGGQVLCTSCLATIQPLTPPFCHYCQAPLSPNDICLSCQYQPLHLSGLRAFSLYREPLRSCIHALKYNGNTRLAQPLGILLAQAYHAYGMHADLIVPVPLHNQRQQQRGYNQAQLLAEVCSSHLHIPLNSSLLTRIRPTAAQVGLTAPERQQNVAGAFLCTPAFTTGTLAGRSILLIDDVSTTGATLQACAFPLFAAGAQAVWGLVLARPTPSEP